MYRKLFYRIFDFTLSVLFLLIFFWLYVVIIIFLRIKIGSPVFFYQKRLGLNGKNFDIIKFRTFSKNKIIKEIAYLRKFKLDELPQIFNVLKGDMSVVGPRPLKAEYADILNKHFKSRFNVKPGLTGLVQISTSISDWNTYFIYDLEYIKNKTFILDLKIIILTLFKFNDYKPGKNLIDLNQFLKKNKLRFFKL